MNVRPLILDEATREIFRRMIAAAEKNRVNLGQLEAFVAGKGTVKPLGDLLQDQVCTLHFGYKIVFTIEEQKIGWSRHLSCSVTQDKPGVWPNPMAVEMIMKEFGFKCGLRDAYSVYQEPEFHAINVIELMEVVP